MWKKILLNLILIIIVVISSELFYFYKVYDGDNLKTYIDNVIFTMPVDEYFRKLYAEERVDGAFSTSFRPDENKESKLKPILFMGCSFTYGAGLEENETVSYKTGVLTKRPIYNRGGMGWGLDQLVYQFKKPEFIKTIPEPEFLIFTFIIDHLGRIDKYKIVPNCKEFQPHFRINKDNSLTEIKPKFYDYFMTVEHFLYNKYYHYGLENCEKEKILKAYFYEALKEMRKYWKNTKFVILLYPIGYDSDIFNLSCWKEMEKDFIIIDINKLTNKKMEEYKCLDKWHPSAEAWDIILEPLLKELKIQ